MSLLHCSDSKSMHLLVQLRFRQYFIAATFVVAFPRVTHNQNIYYYLRLD